MRPRSVIHAERVYLVATALLVVTTVATWQATADVYGVVLTAGISAFLIGLYLLLILLTTRRTSRVALWLLVVLTAIGVVSLLYQIATGTIAFGWLGVLNTIQVVLTVIGAVLLFRPNARAWFAAVPAGWQEDA